MQPRVVLHSEGVLAKQGRARPFWGAYHPAASVTALSTLTTSLNFSFLKAHDARLVMLGAQAEKYFPEDPGTCLIKLRQFAEVMAKIVAARTATDVGPDDTFSDILRRLKAERTLPPSAADLFYKLKGTGNSAVHDLTGTHGDALVALRIAWTRRASPSMATRSSTLPI
jgi:hypothetical protein